MKRTSICLLFVFTISLGYGQRWSVLSQAADTLHFENSKSYIFSFVADSVFVGSNYRYIKPQPALDISDFYAPAIGRLDGASWIGNEIIETQSEITFVIRGDSLVLPLSSSSANFQVQANSVVVHQDSTVYRPVPSLGVQDSVKYYHFTAADSSLSCLDGSIFAISKDNGLVQFPACFTKTHDLMLQEEIVGNLSRTQFSLLKTEELFDYAPGDILHYENTIGPFSPSDILIVSKSFLGRTVDSSNAKITYSVFDTSHFYTTSTGPGNPPRRIDFGFFHNLDYYLDENALAYDISLMPYSNSNELEIIYKNPSGVNLCYDVQEKVWMKDMATLGFPGKRGIRLFSQFEANGSEVFQANYQYGCNWSIVSFFVEGIGLVKSRWWDGTLNVEMELEYAKIKGVQAYGNPINYFSIDENRLEIFEVFPNPTAHILQFRGLDVNTNYTWKIYSTYGKLLQEGEIDNDFRIDVSLLESGVYLIHIEDGKPIRFVKI